MSNLSIDRVLKTARYRLSYSGTTPSEELSTVFTHSWTDSVIRPTVHNYKWRIANGVNATSTLIGSRSSIDFSPGFALLHYNVNKGLSPQTFDRYRRETGFLCAGVNIPAAADSSLYPLANNLALTQAHKDITRIYTAFQGGVFLGELRETLRTLRNPAQALRHKVDDYFKKLKKASHRSSSYKRRYLSETYLEASFGWMPLISDIEDANTILHKRRRQLEQTLIRFSGVGTNFGTAFSPFSLGGIGGLDYRYRTRTISGYHVRYFGAVKSKASNPASMDAHLLGFNPRSFVPTAWELMPWSFAIDYFSNIGDVLSAWANQDASYAWIARTTRRQSLREVVDMSPEWPSNKDYVLYSTQFTPCKCSLTRVDVDRRPIAELGVPNLAFELPGFSRKWLNLAALVRTHRSLTPFF